MDRTLTEDTPPEYQWVADHRDDIMERANGGDCNARAIITCHRLLVACPEPAAFGILQGAIHEYQHSEG